MFVCIHTIIGHYTYSVQVLFLLDYILWLVADGFIVSHTVSMSYDIPTHINLKKNQATKLWQPSTELPMGSRLFFFDWLSPFATLSTPTA